MKTTPIKTKKEILDKYPSNFFGGKYNFAADKVLLAMEEYRNQSRPALADSELRNWMAKYNHKMFMTFGHDILVQFQSHLLSQEGKEESKPKEVTDDEMYLNMQYYMEYCQTNGYVTPQEWIEKYKHF